MSTENATWVAVCIKQCESIVCVQVCWDNNWLYYTMTTIESAMSHNVFACECNEWNNHAISEGINWRTIHLMVMAMPCQRKLPRTNIYVIIYGVYTVVKFEWMLYKLCSSHTLFWVVCNTMWLGLSFVTKQYEFIRVHNTMTIKYREKYIVVPICAINALHPKTHAHTPKRRRTYFAIREMRSDSLSSRLHTQQIKLHSVQIFWIVYTVRSLLEWNHQPTHVRFDVSRLCQ